MKWIRNKEESKIAGICSGLSEMFSIDVTLVRFIFAILCLTPVPIITAYLLAWFIVPKKGDVNVKTVNVDATTGVSSGSKEFLAE